MATSVWSIFTKAIDTVTFIKLRGMLVVSGSILNSIVKQAKEPKEDKVRSLLRRRENKFIVFEFLILFG